MDTNTPLLLDPHSFLGAPRLQPILAGGGTSEKRLWEAPSSVACPRGPRLRTCVSFTLKDVAVTPTDRVTHGTGFCPSHPCKRLFPRGLVSHSILFGAVFIFQLSSGRNIRIGSLPGCETSFPFLLPLRLQYEEGKSRAPLKPPAQVIRVLWLLFPGRSSCPRVGFVSGALEGPPFSSCFLSGVSGL